MAEDRKKGTENRGFASMPHEKVQEIASKGGKASGHSHSGSDDNRRSASREDQNYKGSEHHEHGKQGFASMPHEKVQEIASKGGHASAEKAGHEGMAERGHKGGEARKEQIGPEGYAEMGHKGGKARSGQGSSSSDED